MTGVKAGTATITAKLAGRKLKCQVTVKDKMKPTDYPHFNWDTTPERVFSILSPGYYYDEADNRVTYYNGCQPGIYKM